LCWLKRAGAFPAIGPWASLQPSNCLLTQQI
jgi:hypothetical protein